MVAHSGQRNSETAIPSLKDMSKNAGPGSARQKDNGPNRTNLINGKMSHGGLESGNSHSEEMHSSTQHQF